MKMTETSAFNTPTNQKKETTKCACTSFARIIENWAFRFLSVIARFIFQLIYGVKGQSMPAITDPILLESASSLARKIRKQEVRSFFIPYQRVFIHLVLYQHIYSYFIIVTVNKCSSVGIFY